MIVCMDKDSLLKEKRQNEQFTLGRAQNVKDIWNYLQILSLFIIIFEIASLQEVQIRVKIFSKNASVYSFNLSNFF